MKKPSLVRLRRSLAESPVIKRGEYDYFINPMTDGLPALEPEILGEACEAIREAVNFSGVDRIVTIESMGIHVGAVLSAKTGVPLTVIRKKQYWLPGEILLDQTTGYSHSTLYLNGIPKGAVVVLVDSIISTGGTMTAALKGLKEAGATVRDAVAVVERGSGVLAVKKETGVTVKTLVKIDVTEKRVKVT